MSELYLKCLAFAAKKHDGQYRGTGESYITHPVAVAGILESKGFKEDKYTCVALLHDVLEDTETTVQDIIDLTEDNKIAERVMILSKVRGYNMDDYICCIANDEVAKMVKLADRLHNSQTAKGMSEKFRKQYVAETEIYFYDLAKGTVFEQDIFRAVEDIKRTYTPMPKSFRSD
jgi:guanosine-3',5'-bis(diphosphate) 3'-pyrophosphohydrolase